jgi:hypothetical protein
MAQIEIFTAKATLRPLDSYSESELASLTDHERACFEDFRAAKIACDQADSDVADWRAVVAEKAKARQLAAEHLASFPQRTHLDELRAMEMNIAPVPDPKWVRPLAEGKVWGDGT